jgi:hypothetical protein
MQKRQLLAALSLALQASFALAQAPQLANERPTLVLAIVVDQMRYDYLARYGSDARRLGCADDAGGSTLRLASTVTLRSVPAGTTLWFPWAIIGRDPAATPEAERFNPDRDRVQSHVGFALGAHMCLGQWIARAQIAEGLHQIAKRIVRPTSTGPQGWRPFPGVWGIRGLPIEFEPA